MRYLIAALAVILLSSCSASKTKGPQATGSKPMTAEELLLEAKGTSERALKVDDNKTRESLALHGISVAEQCLMRTPEEPGCYYYRAINRGIYHETKVIGYQNGVKQMIKDCEMVIKLDPKYDHGGAYRILGQIYTKLPQSVGRPDSVSRDIEKAEEFLEQALRIDPSYPENQIFFAETLIEKEEINEAIKALDTAREIAPRWRKDNSYDSWQLTMRELEKKINKVKKQ